MRYIKIENNSAVNYTIEQLFNDDPTAVIYAQSQMPDEQLLAKYNVYPLVTEPMPQLAEDETAEEGTPIFAQNEWHQTWTVRKLTNNEVQQIIDSRSTFVAEGIDTSFFANDLLQAQRYEHCKSCSAFTAFKTCTECGCIMPLKIRLASASCPLAKW